jgi:hypothetical protein
MIVYTYVAVGCVLMFNCVNFVLLLLCCNVMCTELSIDIECVKFWVFPRRLVYIGRRFGTLCQVHLPRLDVEICTHVDMSQDTVHRTLKLRNVFLYSSRSVCAAFCIRVKGNCKNITLTF